MFKRQTTFALAVSGLAVGVAAGAFAGLAGRADGFGPKIFNDTTLNENLGVLAQQIAWLNSTESDLYQLAQATSPEDNFENVAQLTGSNPGQGYFPSVNDDSSLNHSNGILSQLIAWQNSPEGDVFMVAQAEPQVTGDNFQRVALASIR